ncbi:DNA alkylation repair protein [Cryobacterium psychrophilum]
MFELAGSEALWRRRVAMVGSLGLIMRGDASTTLELATRLLGDREPLMHKAVGWMLREPGKHIDQSRTAAVAGPAASRSTSSSPRGPRPAFREGRGRRGQPRRRRRRTP